jgi:hypothetical protein
VTAPALPSPSLSLALVEPVTTRRAEQRAVTRSPALTWAAEVILGQAPVNRGLRTSMMLPIQPVFAFNAPARQEQHSYSKGP